MNSNEEIWDLGHGTQVRILQIGELEDLPDGGGSLPVDFSYEKRGRLSRRAIKKKIARMMMGMVVIEIGKHDLERETSYWRKRAERERKWLDKNIDLVY